MNAAAVGDGEFAARMAEIGDFETSPLLVAAVSGGADSMALALLAHAWAARRGGAALALTVDHQLRPESADEAAGVGRLLAARGIAHEIVTWDGGRRAAGVEAAARAARYSLLADCCGRLGALHLLTAHHAEDQAETVLLRLARGSGPDGLAGMAPARNLGGVRLLRPLLGMAPERLRATCRAAGLTWFDDPSNQGDGNARARLRRLRPLLAAEGLSAGMLNQTAARAAAQRRLLDGLTADLLARAVAVSPYGFAEIDGAALSAADPELALRALARVLATVGGGGHPPRRDGLARLAARLRTRSDKAATATLAGCLVRRRADSRIVVCREPAAIGRPLRLPPGGRGLWDGRFSVALASSAPDGLTVAARGFGTGKIPGVPAAAFAALPALVADSPVFSPGELLSARFVPAHPLAGAPFLVVSAAGDII